MSGIVQEFKDTDEGWDNLIGYQTWQVFLYGGHRALSAEERCRKAFSRFSSVPGIRTFGLNRTAADVHYEFEVTSGSNPSREITLSQLNIVLNEFLPESCKNVILDLTSLELDTTLYLLAFLRSRGVKNLVAIYLVPENYHEHERGLDYQDIQQPRGYISLVPALAGERDAAHYILLGFDRGRANRFIERYDWDWNRIHSVVGDPSYIPNGVKIALDANNDWLCRTKDSHLHHLSADDPIQVRDYFRSIHGRHAYIDVVPLGPKPMLLGFLLFYWHLDESERRKIRLLYDFPTPKIGCTAGVAKCYSFNLVELLK